MSERAYLESDAVISDCGKYRYLLRRTWDHEKPRILFVMLNPSTADASVDDPTIKSCVRLAKSWGYGSFEIVNLYAWRATDPEELKSKADPVGPSNDNAIMHALRRCDLPIVAWGKHATYYRARHVYGMLKAERPAVFCVGKNKDGTPKHPLYIKSGVALEAFRP